MKNKLPPGVHFDSTKKGSNAYYFVVRVGNKIKCQRGFATSEDAYLALIDYKKHPISVENRIKLEEIANRWIKHSSEFYAVDTLSWYKGLLKNYIYPYLNKNYIYKDIDDSKINFWRDKINRSDSISIRIKNRLITLLKLLYDYARIYINIDNKSLLRINKFSKYDFTPFFENNDVKKYITPEELNKLISVSTNYFKLMYLISYCCGLRLGEVRGLTVNNFNGSAICIVKQASRNVSREKIKKLKSRSSRRLCFLPKSLSELLGEHIQMNKLGEEDFIFFSPQSKKYPCSAHYIRYNLKYHVKKAGLDEDIHFHLFRHSAATYLDQKGFKTSAIKNYLGHVSEHTTKKYYIHSTKEDLEEISSVFSQILVHEN